AVVGMRKVEAIDMIGERVAAFGFGPLGIRHQANSKSALAIARAMHLFIKHHTQEIIPTGGLPMHRNAVRTATAFLAFAPTVASAHPGHDGAGLIHGFLHPLGGVDHIIAMVAVGLLAARLGGRALWLVPASFVVTLAGARPPRPLGAGPPPFENRT